MDLGTPKLRPPTVTGHGQIQVIFGPMFSGKTTELIRRLKRYQIANHKCLIVKYAKDDRYDKDGIATHDKQTLPATSVLKMSDLKTSTLNSFSVIGIDEGQFFPDVVPFAEQMTDKGKIIIVAALDGDFQRKGFGDILHLVPIAESIVKLNAVCMMCFQEASFTKRKGSETAVEVIGGQDKYLAACRACYFKSPSKRSADDSNKQQQPLQISNAKTASPAIKNAKKSPMKQRHLSGGKENALVEAVVEPSMSLPTQVVKKLIL